MFSVVGGFDLKRSAQIELTMEAFVVPPPHVFQSCELDFLHGLPRSALTDKFSFVERVHGLSHRIVELSPTVPVDGIAPSSWTRPV